MHENYDDLGISVSYITLYFYVHLQLKEFTCNTLCTFIQLQDLLGSDQGFSKTPSLIDLLGTVKNTFMSLFISLDLVTYELCQTSQSQLKFFFQFSFDLSNDDDMKPYQ